MSTSAELQALKDDILALPPETLQTHEVSEIAAQLNVGRTKLIPMEIGNGFILATIGLTSGNALLDVIYNTPDFRHVKPLLEQGRLEINSPLARGALDALVGVCITQAEADALKSLAEVPDPVNESDVKKICWNDDGSWAL